MGWYLRAEIIWHKPNQKPSGGNKGTPHRDFEHIWWLTKSDDHFYGSDAVHQVTRQLRCVWSIKSGSYKSASGRHFAAFPEELVQRMIDMGCPEEGTVVDPFAGTFTVPAVAQKMGRNWYGSDLSEEYCEIGRERLGLISREVDAWR